MIGQEPFKSNDDKVPCTPGKKPELITLLLEEYKGLRAEITQRLNARMQICALTTVVSASIVTSGGLSFRKPYIYVAILILVIGLVGWIGLNRMTQRVADHVRKLEQRMNELARAPMVLRTLCSRGKRCWITGACRRHAGAAGFAQSADGAGRIDKTIRDHHPSLSPGCDA
jgi:hypothetical protein